MLLHTEESIVAIATPPGKGAIAVVRLSGDQAFELARKQIQVNQGEPEARTVHLGHFLDLQGQILDEVLFVRFPGPNSYTGEDLVEISCHGSPVIAQSIVNTLLAAGARLAEPGEFTLRAVLHGKMDLLQAEGVQDLVESTTSLQAQQATKQLLGQLSGALDSVRKDLLELVCQLESGIEFVEEGLTLASPEEVLSGLRKIDLELEKLERSFRDGQILRDGIRAVFAGKPNVGKSSIFNSLVGHDSAIVTPTPGTTRDALSEMISVDGIPVTLVDTAGIREEEEDTVEHLGVERSLRNLKAADLVLFVVDRSAAYDEEDESIWKKICEHPYLLLANKIDLEESAELPGRVVSGSLSRIEVSALRGTNLNRIRSAIARYGYPDLKRQEEGPTMTRLRHKKCIEQARKELRTGISNYAAGAGEEVALVGLRKALEALGELTGEVTTKEILNQVFASFCIGK
jgi:tRNA modification GTPase